MNTAETEGGLLPACPKHSKMLCIFGAPNTQFEGFSLKKSSNTKCLGRRKSSIFERWIKNPTKSSILRPEKLKIFRRPREKQVRQKLRFCCVKIENFDSFRCGRTKLKFILTDSYLIKILLKLKIISHIKTLSICITGININKL